MSAMVAQLIARSCESFFMPAAPYSVTDWKRCGYNVRMTIDHRELFGLFSGPTEIARFLGIKQPSVQGWKLADGRVSIPVFRLMQLAPEIEVRSGGRISRKDLFPDCWQKYWPELDKQAD